MKPSQVLAALNTWDKGPFSYGSKDCVVFAVHMIRELYGIDYSKELTYKTEEEADLKIAKAGGFGNLIDSVLGEPSEDSVTGDIVLFRAPISGLAMGVKLGRSVVCVTRKGLTRVPEKYIVRSWKCQQH
jgi:hypothetical protein